jgi:pyruvate/2-oxoglutarate dehydrogenase complex dihydrolipoamide dehydrogenase (E3) component
LAQLLPHRAGFGGIATNLTREALRHGVTIHKRSEVSLASIKELSPDAIILATGSKPQKPVMEGQARQLLHAQDVLAGAGTGSRVVIYDWMADWIGSGIAERLASEGVHVRLAVNGVCAAVSIQNYIRDEINARLFKLGVEVLPWMRLYGADDRTVYFLHTAAQEPVVLEDVDTLVLAYPNTPQDELAAGIGALGIPFQMIGDCLSPRTAEEAVYEGLKAGMAV